MDADPPADGLPLGLPSAGFVRERGEEEEEEEEGEGDGGAYLLFLQAI